MVPVNVINVLEFSENLVSLKVLTDVQEGLKYLLADPFIYVFFFFQSVKYKRDVMIYS